MSNYVKLTNNLELLKLEKIKENIDQYIDMHYTSIENIHKVIAPLFFLLLYLLIYFLLLYVLHPLLVLYLDSLLDFHPLAICNILLCY